MKTDQQKAAEVFQGMGGEFIWDGRALTDMGHVMDAAIKIARKKNRKLAKEFIETYVNSGTDVEIVRQNLGYMAGYYDRIDATLIYDIFDVSHPMFGRTTPTAEEAFKWGMELGRKHAGKNRRP